MVTAADGGIRTHVTNLVRALDSEAFGPVWVVGPVGEDWEAELTLARPGLRLAGRAKPAWMRKLGVGWAAEWAAEVRDAAMAWDLAAKGGIIHAHGAKAAAAVALVLQPAVWAGSTTGNGNHPRRDGGDVGFVFTAHGFAAGRTGVFLHRLAALGRPRVVAVSRAVADELKRVAPRSGTPTVIMNGVDARLFSIPRTVARGVAEPLAASAGGSAGAPYRFGVACRLAREKGLDVLLEAAALLSPVGSAPAGGWEIHIAGEGPEGPALEQRARELALAGRVFFSGRVGDMPAFYGRLDALVLPSRREGLSMAVEEAMAAGLPVVASRVGGVPELVEEACCGVLTEPGSAQALAGAMDGLLSGKVDGRALGAAGQAFARENLSVERMARATEEVYRQALRSGQSQAELIRPDGVGV